MTTRIDALTPEQTAAMHTWADEWIKRGLDTSPADRNKVEEGIRACYRYAGLDEPKVVVWVDNPLTLSIAAPTAAYLIDRNGDSAGLTRPVDGAVDDAVYVAVHGAVAGAVRGAVVGAVGNAVYGAVGDAVHDTVSGAVYGAVGDAVSNAVHGAVDGAVYGAVYGAVDGAVHGAVHGAVANVRSRWRKRFGGSFWAYWNAYSSFFREQTDLQLPGDLWDRDRAYADAQSAGWWWPHREFVMVCDRPDLIVREQIGPRGWGSHQLHNDRGPAIRWRDGWALHFWHGTRVPAWVIEAPSVELIQAEKNSEIRRCAIEAYGWDRYLEHLGATPIDQADDPGNPGHTLRLYDVPNSRELYDGNDVRLLVMDNASRDRDGSRRTYAETVPATIATCVAAAAWQFDLPETTYRELVRAT